MLVNDAIGKHLVAQYVIHKYVYKKKKFCFPNAMGCLSADLILDDIILINFVRLHSTVLL